MRRRKLLAIIAAAGLIAVAATVAVVAFSLKTEPDFYRQCELPEGKARKTKSAEFLGIFSQLASNIVDGKGKWQISFTQDQINSYFCEDFIRLGDAAHLQRQGISEPRVVFEKDRLRLAFRY